MTSYLPTGKFRLLVIGLAKKGLFCPSACMHACFWLFFNPLNIGILARPPEQRRPFSHVFGYLLNICPLSSKIMNAYTKRFSQYIPLSDAGINHEIFHSCSEASLYSTIGSMGSCSKSSLNNDCHCSHASCLIPFSMPY